MKRRWLLLVTLLATVAHAGLLCERDLELDHEHGGLVEECRVPGEAVAAHVPVGGLVLALLPVPWSCDGGPLP